MKMQIRICQVFLLLAFSFAPAMADEYSDTIKIFQDADESGSFFEKSYGYAVFPAIGKNESYGKGRVYVRGNYVGDTTVTQAGIGYQLGGQVYSQIIFFEDKRAFDEFTSGNFEFGVQASAAPVTVAASEETTTYLRESGDEITNISFGPPEVIRPKIGQTTEYSFYSRAEFEKTTADVWRINPIPPKNVAQQQLPERIRKDVWIGKDGSLHWNGLNWEEHPSVGLHELWIRAWNREERPWDIGRSDAGVEVLNGD